MTTQNRSILAVALAAFALACTDAATAPSKFVSNSPTATITQQDFTFPPGFPDGLAAGVVRLCKTANHGGTFSFTVTANGNPVSTPSIVIGAGGGTQCTDVFTSSLPIDVVDNVTITEGADPGPEWDLTAINTIRYLATGPLNGGAYPAAAFTDVEEFNNRRAIVRVNLDMSRKVTFTNTFTEPTVGCVYTKGWYKNKNGGPTVIAVDNRTKAEAQAIFLANPGKPNGVTWGSDNLLLNLYQQLLAALNNLGGNANAHNGPQAVDDAIDAALAGTGGTGLNITTTLTHDEMSALVDVLSDFNEGAFAGFPHCPDTPLD